MGRRYHNQQALPSPVAAATRAASANAFSRFMDQPPPGGAAPGSPGARQASTSFVAPAAAAGVNVARSPSGGFQLGAAGVSVSPRFPGKREHAGTALAPAHKRCTSQNVTLTVQEPALPAGLLHQITEPGGDAPGEAQDGGSPHSSRPTRQSMAHLISASAHQLQAHPRQLSSGGADAEAAPHRSAGEPGTRSSLALASQHEHTSLNDWKRTAIAGPAAHEPALVATSPADITLTVGSGGHTLPSGVRRSASHRLTTSSSATHPWPGDAPAAVAGGESHDASARGRRPTLSHAGAANASNSGHLTDRLSPWALAVDPALLHLQPRTSAERAAAAAAGTPAQLRSWRSGAYAGEAAGGHGDDDASPARLARDGRSSAGAAASGNPFTRLLGVFTGRAAGSSSSGAAPAGPAPAGSFLGWQRQQQQQHQVLRSRSSNVGAAVPAGGAQGHGRAARGRSHAGGHLAMTTSVNSDADEPPARQAFSTPFPACCDCCCVDEDQTGSRNREVTQTLDPPILCCAGTAP